MSTIYKRRIHTLAGLPYPAELHLTMGDCMIRGGCSLCVEVAGPDADLPRVLDLKRARVAWALHRDDILARWYARLDALKSPGWPCAGEVLFDGVDLPQANPRWNERVRAKHRFVEWQLYALHEYLRAHRGEPLKPA